MCDYETIESVNDELFSNLSELVEKPFFRYFQVRSAFVILCPLLTFDAISRSIYIVNAHFGQTMAHAATQVVQSLPLTKYMGFTVVYIQLLIVHEN